jgi:phage terminase large subunit-like protein
MADSENWILKYYQAIKDGSVTVGHWIHLLYERIIQDLENRVYFFDQKKANRVISFFENFCHHSKGKLAPQLVKLELWQKANLSCLFGIVDETGYRHFREVFWVNGRKCGKSLVSSAVLSYVWHNGGFGTRCYNVAPKLDQAEIVYNNVWVMTTLDPEWQRREEMKKERDAHNKKIFDDSMQERHRMSDLFIPGTNSTVKKLSLDSKRSDGFNVSVAVLDEISGWEGDRALKAYEVIRSGFGSREEPILFSISTAGYISDGPYDELMKRSTSFLLGNSKERRLLPFLYMIDDVSKWNDINELRKSLPNLGVSVSVDYMLEEIAIAEGSLSKKAEFLAKYCNIKQNSSQAWLDAQTVEKTVSEPLHLEDYRNHYAVMGIDLSKTTDLSAAVLIIEKDGILNTFARFYLPKEKIEEATQRDGLPYRAYIRRGLLFESGDNFIDYRDIVEWVRELVTEYRIYPLMIGYDRYSATYMVQDLKDGGCRVDDVYQGTNLTPIIRLTEGYMKDGRIRIGDNDLLKIHFLNSALKVDAENERLRLIKIEQRAHIDGMAAFLDAMTVRDKYWGEIGAQLVNERR